MKYFRMHTYFKLSSTRFKSTFGAFFPSLLRSAIGFPRSIFTSTFKTSFFDSGGESPRGLDCEIEDAVFIIFFSFDLCVPEHSGKGD